PSMILNELAAARAIRVEIRIRRVENARDSAIDVLHDARIRWARPIERLPVPGAIAEANPPIVRQRDWERIRGIDRGNPGRLAPRLETRIDLRARFWVASAAVDASRRFHLRV